MANILVLSNVVDDAKAAFTAMIVLVQLSAGSEESSLSLFDILAIIFNAATAGRHCCSEFCSPSLLWLLQNVALQWF